MKKIEEEGDSPSDWDSPACLRSGKGYEGGLTEGRKKLIGNGKIRGDVRTS